MEEPKADAETTMGPIAFHLWVSNLKPFEYLISLFHCCDENNAKSQISIYKSHSFSLDTIINSSSRPQSDLNVLSDGFWSRTNDNSTISQLDISERVSFTCAVWHVFRDV